MKQHGLARISRFELVASEPTSCVYRLTSSPETWLQYPFDFELTATYTLSGCSLAIDVKVVNGSDRTMPLSFGFHPAFRWPASPDRDKSGYRIEFAEAEPAPIRRLPEECSPGKRG